MLAIYRDGVLVQVKVLAEFPWQPAASAST